MTDFGLARVPGESNLTLTGDVLGTLRVHEPGAGAGEAQCSTGGAMSIRWGRPFTSW